MRNLALRLLTVLALFACAWAGASDLGLSGNFRSDLGIARLSGRAVFSAGLRGSLRFQRQAESWRFRSDLRGIAWYGSVTNLSGRYTVSLLDMFVRYSPGRFDLTLGKNYAPLGILSVFNPFETTKTLTLTDLKYEKEGILLAMADAALGQLSGIRLYLNPASPLQASGAGFSAFTHLLKSDVGLVLQRKTKDGNVFGVYLKGDLVAGVNAAWAFHVDDGMGNGWNEASLGADYSFFAGRLVASGTLYYAEHRPGPGIDRFMTARLYVLSDLVYTADEFFSAGFDLFVNGDDGSCLGVGSATFLLADGLSLSVLASAPTGGRGDEFSRRTLGDFSLGCRIEAKL